MGTTISEQAERYAEVITEQIADNFQSLADAIKECAELEVLSVKYEKISPTDSTLNDVDKLKEKIDVIKKSIGDSICDEYNTIEPLVVGLFGEWGSGKTHQLKLIKKRILEAQKELGDSGKFFPQTTIPVFFNAWRFEKEEHIIIPLFQTLLHAVENHERSFKDTIGRSLKSTVFHLKNVLTSLHHGLKVPKNIKSVVAGLLAGDISGVSEFVDLGKANQNAEEETNEEQAGVQTLSELIKPDELESIYLNIPQWIEKITLFEKVNFVFLIDDLDRCLPENTLKMLESIKLFLDVPSCAFVLAVDDDVVERGVLHHYRDYLRQSKKHKQHELPITGHEYLEKMIQLPMRLPTPNRSNVREFLKTYSEDWKALVNEDFDANANSFKNQMSKDHIKAPYDELMDFFVKSIPPKPRKIKRVALLFESKLRLMGALELKVDLMLLAKMVLLELFAPKLLRFMQGHHKYYESLFSRLEEFRFAGKKDEKNSLEDTTVIDAYIKSKQYTEKFTKMYLKMMEHIKEHYSGRVRFELDYVFDGSYKDVASLGKDLQHIMECSKEATYEAKEEKYIYSENFETLLFSDDRTSWYDAFKEDNLFAEGKAVLSDVQLQSILENEKAEELKKNASWLTILAKYATIEQIKQKGFLYFEMSPTTVTKKEFAVFIKETDYKTDAEKHSGANVYDGHGGSLKKDAFWKNSYIEEETDKHPVVCVSWNDTQAYIAWINKKEEKTYRLPTQAEWELSCNLGKDTLWHFGDDERQLKDYAWYRENSETKTHEVTTLKPNALGLYDMHGNVWEWCEDWENEDKDIKVLKGGSWYNYAPFTQTFNNYRGNPHNSNNIVGFRLLRTLP